MAIAIASVESAVVLTNSEIGSFAFGDLALWARQGCSNQRTMHGPFVIGLFADLGLGFGVRFGIDGWSFTRDIEQIDRRTQCLFDHDWRFWIGHRRTGKRCRFGGCRRQCRLRLLAP